MRIVILIIIFVLLAVFVYPQLPNRWFGNFNFQFPEKQFRLGLDLLGGAQLVYEADLVNILESERGDSMEGVRDVIERRVNLFGVAEPVVQISGRNRLIVEMPQVKDVAEAIQLIGETPFLEFKKLPESFDMTQEISVENFTSTGLSGKQLKRAYLSFDSSTNLPHVSLEFNNDGKELLSEISKRNLSRPLAIFLDGQPISIPIVRDEITNGQAVIDGQFTINDARDLAIRLSAGALPVPIHLISQQTIGPSLGRASLEQSLKAGLYGLIALVLFMVIFYRGYGLIAVFALFFYTVSVLTIFKLLPVTLTLAGIAGFILSLGMAVDGNILIFSRIKEEIREGKSRPAAMEAGFSRAWSSIRDSQITTLIAAVILYIFATSLVKGFALTLAIGTIFSIFSAVYVTKAFLRSIYK
ncbi:MAG: protein-export membrane protein SecD [Parcubacteria group bacterium RIFCSPLOWO2_12_FULL_40_10]|nr:MAG: protein-export membrane protein SecD [Parcubacteria group bacterium RIFCSPHIGHO2_02_FULL_40_12]OHB23293.1 MAG: protein-export membrane protein SecD [Parcubacteria group bacterium RIFCSPLOWO2_02_FULL_40_12]OHB24118.1 MAG: protein-export membrane protein SecD [Parcubacteria group bacterium RIFCSPLOWO2_12_FULL_40_10]